MPLANKQEQGLTLVHVVDDVQSDPTNSDILFAASVKSFFGRRAGEEKSSVEVEVPKEQRPLVIAPRFRVLGKGQE